MSYSVDIECEEKIKETFAKLQLGTLWMYLFIHSEKKDMMLMKMKALNLSEMAIESLLKFKNEESNKYYRGFVFSC